MNLPWGTCTRAAWFLLGVPTGTGTSLGLVELFPQQSDHSVLSNHSCLSFLTCVGSVFGLRQGTYCCFKGKLCPSIVVPVGLCLCGPSLLQASVPALCTCVSRELISLSVSQAPSRRHFFLCVCSSLPACLFQNQSHRRRCFYSWPIFQEWSQRPRASGQHTSGPSVSCLPATSCYLPPGSRLGFVFRVQSVSSRR